MDYDRSSWTAQEPRGELDGWSIAISLTEVEAVCANVRRMSPDQAEESNLGPETSFLLGMKRPMRTTVSPLRRKFSNCNAPLQAAGEELSSESRCC